MKTGRRGEIRDGPTSARTPETGEAVAGVVEEQLSLRNVDDGRNLRASSCLNSFMEKTYRSGGERADSHPGFNGDKGERTASSPGGDVRARGNQRRIGEAEFRRRPEMKKRMRPSLWSMPVRFLQHRRCIRRFGAPGCVGLAASSL
jgi:hypothetical protein